MKNILKYLKPYVFVLIVTVILIYIQAMGNLRLPDYMADIVNIGIQSSGIEDATPKAISENSLELLKNFMTEEDKAIVEENYILLRADSNDEITKNYIEEYPLLKDSNIYILNEDSAGNEDVMEKLDSIFMVTDKVVVDVITHLELPLANTEGENTSSSAEFNFSELSKIMPLVLNSMTPELLENSIETAKNMEETMLSQVALAFTKAFYTEVGLEIEEIQSNYMFKIGAIMIATTLIIIAVSIAVGYIAAKLSAAVARNLRQDIFEKVQKFSEKEFAKIGASSLITRTTNDVMQVQNMIFMVLRIVFFAIIMMIGAIIMITRTANSMLWVLLLGLGLILVLILITLLISMPKFKIFQGLIDKLNLISRETLNGIMVIRAFGTQKYEEKRFDKANYELANTMFFIDKVMAFMMPAMTIIMNLLTLLIVWVGADKIATSDLQVGNMMAAIQYTMQVMMSFLMISMLFIMFPRALVSINRISEVLNMKIDIKDPQEPKDFDKDKIGYVEFKNVSFRYDDADEDVLKDISFVAKPGETTAIIGSTGSGKTTILKLIPRFYDVTGGELLVNGVNIKDVNLHDLHETIAYIPQKPSLLSGTIESNLKYGKKDASMETVEKCAEIAQAKEFIDEKENKYEEAISQAGTNISGGQKQRLSIARALVKGAPIYLFDDCFSALDFKTDLNLRTALKENFKDVTKIIVAQRINTIIDAEQIIVLEEGRIVGKGTHEELMKTCKTYKEIADSQLGGEDYEQE